MVHTLLVDANPDERSALGLMLKDLRVMDVHEVADWQSALAEASTSQPDLILVDFELLPSEAEAALESLREVCPGVMILLLLGHLDPRWLDHQTLKVNGRLSKDDSSELVFERLSAVVRSLGREPREK